MVKIRLRRTGAKKKPSYRLVVTDSRAPRDGRFIEIVGHYNPRTEPSTLELHEDRVLYWLSVGAQPTQSVQNLLKHMGTLERFARLKAGADLEELLAEANAAYEEKPEAVEIEPEIVAVDSEEAEEEIQSSEPEAVESSEEEEA